MINVFAHHDRIFGDGLGDKMYRPHIQSILTHDWEGIKLKNFENSMFDKKLKRIARRQVSNAAG